MQMACCQPVARTSPLANHSTARTTPSTGPGLPTWSWSLTICCR